MADLNRYQNVRSASLRDWAQGGQGVYISTRFGEVSQIHHVRQPLIVTAGTPWHVELVAFSEDRKRGAFAVNENGF